MASAVAAAQASPKPLLSRVAGYYGGTIPWLMMTRTSRKQGGLPVFAFGNEAPYSAVQDPDQCLKRYRRELMAYYIEDSPRWAGLTGMKRAEKIRTFMIANQGTYAYMKVIAQLMNQTPVRVLSLERAVIVETQGGLTPEQIVLRYPALAGFLRVALDYKTPSAQSVADVRALAIAHPEVAAILRVRLADKLGVAWFDRAVGRPVITTPNATRFRVGTPGMFTVNATGTPPLTLTGNGALPGGVVFTPGPDASATLAGTPAAGTDGVYAFTNTASNPTHGATQELTVTVDPAGP